MNIKLQGSEIEKVLGPLYAARWEITLERREIADSIHNFHEATDYAYEYKNAPKSPELESLYIKSLDAEKRYLEISKKIEDYTDYLEELEDIEDAKAGEEVSKAASAMGKIGGSSKSESKVNASRANGKLGGRPRKTK